LADRKNQSLKMDCRQNFFMNRGNIEMLKNYQKKFIKSGFVLCTILVCIAIFSLEFAQMSSAKTRATEGNSESVAPAFVDPAFNPILGSANAQWLISRVQPDGKILAAGLVNVVNGTNRNSLARFNADGTLDMTFNTGSGANNIVYGLDLQPDGKILVSGAFTNFNGVTVGRIARLNADGSLDQTFNSVGTGFNANSGGNFEIYRVKVLADGKIMIGGDFSQFNGVARNRLARLNADGSLDTTFTVGSGLNGAAQSIDVQPDGKIVVGGHFSSYSGFSTPSLVRVNSDGSRDTSFNIGIGFGDEIRAVVVQPDGKIVVGGFFESFNGVATNGILRLKSDGSKDDSYTVAGLDAVVLSIALQPDGKMIVGGSFTQIAGATSQCIARLNADGTMDASLSPGTSVGAQTINDIALQPDGKAILVGTFQAYNGTPNGGAIRINSNGSLDTNLASTSATYGNANAMAVQPDGKVVIGGTFTSVNSTARKNIARVNADGTLDASFNPGSGADQNISVVTVQADGKIIIGGTFTNYNGTAINRVARLNADGSLDTGFAVGTGAAPTGVLAIKVQADGKIIIGGQFTTYNGVTVNRFARLNADGTLDGSFNTGTASNGEVRSIVFQPDGKILIGGAFTTYNGTARNRVARLNADGSLDTTFTPAGTNGPVTSVGLQEDGKVVVGGNFTQANALPRNRIARFNADGSFDAAFDPGVGPGVGTATEVTQVLPVANGKTLIAGNFTTFNGQPRNRIARLNANGTLDGTFLNGIGVGTSTGLAVRALVKQPDGKILVGGQFHSFNVSARTGIVRMTNATDTYGDFDGDGKTDFSIMRRPGTSGNWTWWINESATGNVRSFDFGVSPLDVAQPGDFDGDGKDDVAVWRNDEAAFYITQSSSNAVRVIHFGQPGDVPTVEDYDGDGKDDLSVWRAPSAAEGAGQATWFYLGSLNNPNNNITYVPFGMRYGTNADQVDKPYPGDFDGDGRADFRVQRRGDISVVSADTQSVFITMQASNGAVSYEPYGWMSDRIVPGDFDGDGKTDIAVGRGYNNPAGNTVWYIHYTSGIPDYSVVFGKGLGFAQGDYDGDGKTDIGYFIVGATNAETGFWYISSVNGSFNFFQWGAPSFESEGSGDSPIVGYNNR
jgi:uncharacterized delta-60 repeat protein